MGFHVGQKVVCIKRGKWESSHPEGRVPKSETQPVFGRVYTIREIEPFIIDGYQGLLFEEIFNPLGESPLEVCFNASRFRPIIERKTDISIFTKILDGHRQPDLVD